MLPTTNVTTWSSNQITCFLEKLLIEETPLQILTLNAMNKQYGFAKSHNSKILFWYCQLAVEVEDESIFVNCCALHYYTEMHAICVELMTTHSVCQMFIDC